MCFKLVTRTCILVVGTLENFLSTLSVSMYVCIYLLMQPGKDSKNCVWTLIWFLHHNGWGGWQVHEGIIRTWHLSHGFLTWKVLVGLWHCISFVYLYLFEVDFVDCNKCLTTLSSHFLGKVFKAINETKDTSHFTVTAAVTMKNKGSGWEERKHEGKVSQWLLIQAL